MQHISLPEDYSLVLQEVGEHGEEDFSVLAESLNLERPRLAHIVQALRSKGLIILSDTGNGGRVMLVRLSSKGRKLMQSLWPESGMSGSSALSYGY